MPRRAPRPPRFSFDDLAESVSGFRAGEDDDPALSGPQMVAMLAPPPPLLQPEWDWGARMQLPPIRNQKGWNACVAFSAVAMIEARRSLVLHRQDRLIPGFIHNCLLGIGDPAAWANPTLALDACALHGVAVGNEDRLPVPPQVCGLDQRVPIAGWGWHMGANNILNALVSDGPLMVTLYVDPPFFTHRGPSVYAVQPNPAQMFPHAVLLVGYDAAEGWAIVLNSAGPDWGVGGVGRVQIGIGGLISQRSAAAVRAA
jgi:hypothetical protein